MLLDCCYIFRPPKSKHIIGDPPIIALILNKPAPKHIIGDPFNNGGATLHQENKPLQSRIALELVLALLVLVGLVRRLLLLVMVLVLRQLASFKGGCIGDYTGDYCRGYEGGC